MKTENTKMEYIECGDKSGRSDLARKSSPRVQLPGLE